MENTRGCWYCGGELCWNNDFDTIGCGYEFEGMMTSLTCTNCHAEVEYIIKTEEN